MNVIDPNVEPLCPNALTFEELSHTYTRKEERGSFPCCSATTFIKVLCEEFDVDSSAERVAKKRGVSKATVIKEWAHKRDRAANFGTLLHNSMENYLLHGDIRHYVDTFEGDLFKKLPLVTPKDRDNILEYLTENLTDLDQFLKPLSVEEKDYDGLTYYPEHRLTYCVKEGFLCPYLSGTADLVILHPDKKTVSIGDYKTNENIHKKGYNPMLHGFGEYPFNLEDCSLDKYTIQLNVYASMIKSYGFDIGELFLIYMPSSLEQPPVRINIYNYINNEEYRDPFKENFREAYIELLTKYPEFNNHYVESE